MQYCLEPQKHYTRFFLCNVVPGDTPGEAPNNIAQVRTLCNAVLEAPYNSAQEKVLFNVVLIILAQHGTGQNPMQCCSRDPRKSCIRKNPVQRCLDNLETTSKYDAKLAEAPGNIK